VQWLAAKVSVDQVAREPFGLVFGEVHQISPHAILG
jgi:hypothetical protein